MLRAMKALSIFQWLTLCLRRARTRRQLRDLPAHLLDDIGIDGAAREDECGRWPWRGAAPDASNKNARGSPARVARFQMKSDQTLRRSRTTTSTRAIS
jgi:uncharacterized protein YjiS (DUF1127 family)